MFPIILPEWLIQFNPNVPPRIEGAHFPHKPHNPPPVPRIDPAPVSNVDLLRLLRLELIIYLRGVRLHHIRLGPHHLFLKLPEVHVQGVVGLLRYLVLGHVLHIVEGNCGGVQIYDVDRVEVPRTVKSQLRVVVQHARHLLACGVYQLQDHEIRGSPEAHF